MFLLILSLFLQYDLLQCVEFEKVDFNEFLRAHSENSSLRNSTPAVYRLEPITPEYAFFTPPDDFYISPTLEEVPHQTRRSENKHDTRHKISNINYFEDFFFRHRPRPKKYQSFTVIDNSKKSAETQESQEKASLYNWEEHGSLSSKRSSSESEQKGLTDNFEWHITENTYRSSKEKAADNSETSKESRFHMSKHSYKNSKGKESDNSASSREPGLHRTRPPKFVSPDILRTTHAEKTNKHKRTLKPNLLLPVTMLDGMKVDYDADKFKKMTPPKKKHKKKRKKPRKDKLEGLLRDDKNIFKTMRHRKGKGKKVLRMQVIKKKHSTTDRIADNANKFKKKKPHEWKFDDGNDVLKKPHKIKHNHDDGFFGDDNEIFKIMRLRHRKHKNKLVARMHVISDTTKKMWYSDRMIVEPKVDTKTLKPAAREPLIQPQNIEWSRYDESNHEQDTTFSTTIKHSYASSSMEYLRAPLSKNYFFKIMEHRREGYMIVFLIELVQVIATKDKDDVYDLVKHADPIIHRQSKQLQWMGHPFLDVTRKFATMLKVTNITKIQAQAANVYHQLLKRQEAQPAVVNTILEYAETMYDDDEGKVLFDVLRELVTFPKIALSSYWLCNSIINAFLRPFRRLKDTEQLKELMNSINLALTRQNPLRSGLQQPHHSDKGYGAKAGGPAVANQPSPQKKSSNQTGPQITTPRPPWKGKSKHHHRHHKRKRDEEQLLFGSRSTQRSLGLNLTSVTPKTAALLRFRDTTFPSYLML